jgi:hypothetical protein
MVLFLHFIIHIIFVPSDYYLHVKKLNIMSVYFFFYVLCGRRNEIF